MARHARRLIVWTTGVLLSLAVLVMLAIALLLWGMDPDVFRGRLERAASEALGRPVQLTGALRWRPGWNFQIESRGGRIGNAEGFGPAPLASWQALRLGVELKPLLDDRVVVDRIEVEGLTLDLVRGTRGVNWELPSLAAPADSGASRSMTFAIGRTRLHQARISFTDQVAGRAWSASGLSLDVQLPPQIDAPSLRFSNLSLQARLQGAPLEPAGVALQLTLPRLDVEREPLRLRAPAWLMQWNDARLEGALDLHAASHPSGNGQLRIQAPSLRRLLQTVSVPMPATRDAGVLGPLDLSTEVQVSEDALSLTKLQAKLDATQLRGEVKAPTLAPLSLRFNLAADQVDMDRYLTPEDEPGTPLTLPLAELKALDARGILTIRRATLAGAAARELHIDVD